MESAEGRFNRRRRGRRGGGNLFYVLCALEVRNSTETLKVKREKGEAELGTRHRSSTTMYSIYYLRALVSSSHNSLIGKLRQN